MFRLYIDYWKKIFNYKESSDLKELISAIMFNMMILITILCMGIFVPINLENTLVKLWYGIMYIMILPTVSLMFRILKNKLF